MYDRAGKLRKTACRGGLVAGLYHFAEVFLLGIHVAAGQNTVAEAAFLAALNALYACGERGTELYGKVDAGE